MWDLTNAADQQDRENSFNHKAGDDVKRPDEQLKNVHPERDVSDPEHVNRDREESERNRGERRSA